jgi:hypothetical protein
VYRVQFIALLLKLVPAAQKLPPDHGYALLLYQLGVVSHAMVMADRCLAEVHLRVSERVCLRTRCNIPDHPNRPSLMLRKE